MALKGLKVIEFAGLAPGPFCGMLLADFGATIIRIDRVGANNDNDVLANGKKSIALDLKNAKAIGIIKSLCKKSDVLIEPFRPGVMEKLGLGPKDLLKDNDQLIYARLTGFGQKGYYANRAGHDINYLALTGLLSLFGRSNEKPTFPINLAADFGGGGLMCAVGILLALMERTKSGKGQVIDANMVEGTAYLGSWFYRSQAMQYLWDKERGENILDSGAHFYEVYKTKDNKYMAVGALEPQFYTNLLKGLELSFDDVPQFVDFHKGKELFTRKFLEKTQDDWCKIFDDVDACVTPVLTPEDAYKHPHNKGMETFMNIGNGIVAKPAPKLERTPGKSVGDLKIPEVGENTNEVLKDIGFGDEEISRFNAEGVVGDYNLQSKL